MAHVTPHDLAAAKSPFTLARATAATGAAPDAVLG